MRALAPRRSRWGGGINWSRRGGQWECCAHAEVVQAGSWKPRGAENSGGGAAGAGWICSGAKKQRGGAAFGRGVRTRWPSDDLSRWRLPRRRRMRTEPRRVRASDPADTPLCTPPVRTIRAHGRMHWVVHVGATGGTPARVGAGPAGGRRAEPPRDPHMGRSGTAIWVGGG